MIKRVTILVLVVCSFSALSAQALFPICQSNLWGFIDKEGKEVIKPHYLWVGKFSEGLAPVRINNLYGYINAEGELSIPPEYTTASTFERERARITKGNEVYLIDKEGNRAFDAKVKDLASPDKNGFIFFTTYTGKKGVFNQERELVIDSVYADISPFSEGFAIIRNDTAYNSKAGVIDMQGKLVVPCRDYDSIRSFSNGAAIVKMGKKIGAIDTKGRLLFQSDKWRRVTDFANNRAFAYGKEKVNCRLINKKGEILLDNPELNLTYQEERYRTPSLFADGLAIVWLDSQYVVIDTIDLLFCNLLIIRIIINKYFGIKFDT